jgi:hypothetical protein
MSATVAQVRDDALTIIGEVAGTGVQAYSEDRVKRDVVRSFNLLFKKYNWPQYAAWLRLELDGTTGVIKTDSLDGVRDFEDFISVHPDGKSNPLPIMPNSFNPYQSTMSSGTDPVFWTMLHATNARFRKRKLQIYPTTTTGFINVHAMLYPIADSSKDWLDTSAMELDRDMLAYGTAFMTLSADDLNPQGASVAQNLMEMRYRDIMNKLASHRIPANQSGTRIPNQWMVAR